MTEAKPTPVPVADEAVRKSIPESQKLRTITAVAVAITAIATLVNTQMSLRAAAKVEEVKLQLRINEEKSDRKLSTVVETTDKTLALTNSNMLSQLKVTALALRQFANQSGNPKDAEIATAAEALRDEHIRQQAKIDAGK